jgi:hypothetical protein
LAHPQVWAHPLSASTEAGWFEGGRFRFVCSSVTNARLVSGTSDPGGAERVAGLLYLLEQIAGM